MTERTDLSQDWPADPENDDLLRLAEQMQAAATPLPAEAMTRVERQMRNAMEQQARPQRRRRLVLRYAAAAMILLALGVGGFLSLDTFSPPQWVDRHKIGQPLPVEDRLTIAVGGAGNSTPVEKPLLRLDDYQSLFTN